MSGCIIECKRKVRYSQLRTLTDFWYFFKSPLKLKYVFVHDKIWRLKVFYYFQLNIESHIDLKEICGKRVKLERLKRNCEGLWDIRSVPP